MKYKSMLLVSIALVAGMAQAMQDGRKPEEASSQYGHQVLNQEEKMGDTDRGADSVCEWLLESVEVIEMEQLVQARVEKLFLASWHRKILKEYKPEMLADALTHLEHLADFQALANSEPSNQVERQFRSQARAARAQLERTCMIILLSKLGHAEKKVAEDKWEQLGEISCENTRYQVWGGSLVIFSLVIGAVLPVMRCVGHVAAFQ